jgi:hypothetical protein
LVDPLRFFALPKSFALWRDLVDSLGLESINSNLQYLFYNRARSMVFTKPCFVSNYVFEYSEQLNTNIEAWKA